MVMDEWEPPRADPMDLLDEMVDALTVHSSADDVTELVSAMCAMYPVNGSWRVPNSHISALLQLVDHPALTPSGLRDLMVFTAVQEAVLSSPVIPADRIDALLDHADECTERTLANIANVEPDFWSGYASHLRGLPVHIIDLRFQSLTDVQARALAGVILDMMTAYESDPQPGFTSVTLTRLASAIAPGSQIAAYLSDEDMSRLIVSRAIA